MAQSEKLRRPGYAPSNNSLGRRGRYTRDRVVDCAAKLFVTNGFHGTSVDAIATAVGGSRATVYQYFESKEAIFVELARRSEPAVLEHGRGLGRLGPDIEGMRNLHKWLRDWARLYDRHAMVLLEFPGIGTIQGLPQTDAGAVSERYGALVTDRIREAGVRGIDATDAAAALLRLSHMVNLYRYRGMFGLGSEAETSASLTIAMQLLLFPETPRVALKAVASPHTAASADTSLPEVADLANDEPIPLDTSPIRQDIRSAASVLFTERGFYSVAMEDIAAAANVSRATVYRHFRTKVEILAELTDHATVDGGRLANELHRLAQTDVNFDELRAWLCEYVRFHRSYGGVIRAWYDGTLGTRLADALNQGIGPFRLAATALLSRTQLPAGMDLTVATAIFLAVLGRMSELTIAKPRRATDDDAAGLMMTILRRSMLG